MTCSASLNFNLCLIFQSGFYFSSVLIIKWSLLSWYLGALVVHIFPLFHICRIFNLSVTFVLFQPGSHSSLCVPDTVIHLQPWPQGQLIYPWSLHHLSYFPASPWATTHRVHSFWRNAQNPPSKDPRDRPLGTGPCYVLLTDSSQPANDKCASEGGACLSLSWLAAGWN